MTIEDESSELRKRLQAAQADCQRLAGELSQAQARLADRDIAVFGCSACHGDHRGGLALQLLDEKRVIAGRETNRATICPATGQVIYFLDGPEEVVCDD